MRQLALFLLIVICFCGCGEEETSAPTVVADTTPPTIVGTNVQGGPIPVNTPIVLVFSERVDITSAQSGISVRSSIDAEPVKGVVTLQNGGHEVKFIPTEKMTTGGYVLTAIGIKDAAGNVLLTPVSIFFGAVEVDTTQEPVDVIPPKVMSSIPAEGQSTESTGSITIRFDEEIDAASAMSGIVVSGVEGTVEVTGAVAIFKPEKPMQVGKHTLAIVGIRDLAGNILESSFIIPFEVIAPSSPPPDDVIPPDTGHLPTGATSFRVSSYGGGHQVWFEAEAFSERDPDSDQYFKVAEAKGAFGEAVTRAGGAGGMISWTFDIRQAGGVGGEWYFWARIISPDNQSDYMLVDGDPDDVPIPEGPPYPGEDGTPPFDNDQHRVFEETQTEWAWMPAGHDQGHTKTLADGVNTMYIFHRQGNETVYWDVFMWTDRADYVPTDDDYNNARPVKAFGLAVRPLEGLSTTWGSSRMRYNKAYLKTRFQIDIR